MDRLIQEKCVACRRDAPKLNDSEIAQLKPETPVHEPGHRTGFHSPAGGSGASSA